VAKSWALHGFDVHVIIHGEVSNNTWQRGMPVNSVIVYENDQFITENNPALWAQCCRLYAPGKLNGYVIIGDADMFIGSGFLCRDYDKVNVFGWDLTGQQHIPMCYVGMDAKKWAKIFRLEDFRADLDKYCDLRTKERAWVADQDILTFRMWNYGHMNINFIERGTDPDNHNLPQGRWDRYGGFKKPKTEIHDVHLPREPVKHFTAIKAMCKDIYSSCNWDWLDKYYKEWVGVGIAGIYY
jgi:hypothetical protein